MKPLIPALAAALCYGQLPPPNEAGVTMGHLHLAVTDPDAHRKLWVDVLGATPVKAGPLEMLRFPGVLVALAKRPPSAGTDGSIVNHLGFKVKDLKSTVEKLTAAGAKFERELPETRQAFILFPDGVRVEFTEDAAQVEPIVHHHIHFFTHAVEDMRAWYVKVFGAKPGRRARFEAADVPGVNLTFSPSDNPTAPTKGRGVDHIGFEIRNLEAFCKKLEAEGTRFDVAFRHVPALGVSIAFLTDPWGTYIELTEGLNKL
jgi:catechol 2,3-dioxygenase-like lactoylglutathione lyase family enzyme